MRKTIRTMVRNLPTEYLRLLQRHLVEEAEFPAAQVEAMLGVPIAFTAKDKVLEEGELLALLSWGGESREEKLAPAA